MWNFSHDKLTCKRNWKQAP